MEIKAKFHALLTGKQQPVPTKQEAEWARVRPDASGKSKLFIGGM
jgi:hypothetical protein